MREQISAFTRLQSLEPIFRGSDLTTRFQWNSKTASQYLYQWKRRKLVAPLGGHSDVYANLLVAPVADWGRALLEAMPSAVMIGVEALRIAGWTTQIQRRPAVAVNSAQPVFATDHFEIVKRAPSWYSVASAGIQESVAGLPTLRPAWALADMLRIGQWGRCGLWPDDIDWDTASDQDRRDWHDACARFGLDVEVVNRNLSIGGH